MGMCLGNGMHGRVCRRSLLAALFFLLTSFAAAANPPHYLVTNDDAASPFFSTGVTFYKISPSGTLVFEKDVQTSGVGIVGGYFGSNRLAVLDSGSAECVYASEAFTGDIVGISVDTLTVGGRATGSETDTGATNGIGLAANSQYLYASFSDVNTIGTFQVQPGCSLTFVNDVSVGGLQGGIVNGMTIHGNLMVVTYGDGSIESFDISSGPPVSNDDKQNSTASVKSGFSTYPNSVKITQDGRFAIFGDTASTSVIEVSNISSGKLSRTVSYNLGNALNSSNILLSPDETLLYISNTQGATISAASFNKTTGAVTLGCVSGNLKAYGSSWSYLASLALDSDTGTGDFVYAAEFGATSSIATVQVTSTGGKCALTELSNSPVLDPDSNGLLSIGSFPPPAF